MIVAGDPDEPGRSELRRLVEMMRGRAGLIVSTVLLGLAAGGALLALTPQRWDAEAVVALDARRIQAAPSDALVSRLPNETPALRTELDVIHSRSMAERVLAALGPEMEARLASPSWRETRRDRVTALIASLAGAARAGGRAEPGDADREAAISALVDNLRATNDNRSYTIFFAYSAPDPASAALIANAYAQAYLDHRTESQTTATDQVREMLGERVAVLREQVAAIETQVEARRREAGLFDPEGVTLQERRIGALNLELVAARSERATAEARLAAAREIVAGAGNAAFDALSSDAVAALRRERDALRREAAEIARAGALKSERLPTLRAALDDVEARLAAETALIVEGLAANVRFTGAREAELETELARMEGQALDIEAARGVVRRLEREAAASREIYDAFLARYKQAIEQSGLAVADAALITPAQPPSAPAAPRIGPTLALALFAGLSGGLGLAFAADRLDGRVRSLAATESATRTPVVAHVPRSRFPRPHVAVLDRRRRSAGGVDGLRAALTLSARMRGARAVAVTSARPREGSSTIALALARSVALSGRKVAYVDAGLGRAPSPDIFAKAGADGLRRDPATGVTRFGLRDPGCEIAVGGPDFEALIRRLRKDYDLVVIDAPALSEGADAIFSGALADAVILVARWGRATYDEVAAAARELALCGAPASGIVLNATPRDAIRAGADFARRPAIDLPRLALAREEADREPHVHASEGLRIVGRDAGPELSGGTR